MDTYITDALAYISDLPVVVIYLVLFCLTFSENVFPPAPGDAFIVLGAFLAGQGIVDPMMVFLVTAFGSFSSLFLVYTVARLKGRAFFMEKNYFFLRTDRIRDVEDLFARHGEKIIIASRFFMGIRTVVIILAGVAGVRPWRMTYLSVLGITLWNGILLYAGYTVGQNWQQILDFLAIYNKLILGVMFLALLFYLGRK